MKHKRLFALILAMVMVLGTLAGCGGKTGGDETTKAPAQGTEGQKETEGDTEAPAIDYDKYAVKEPIEIVFWHALKANDKFWEEIIAEFNALSAETKVTVKGESVGSMNNCKDQLSAAHLAQQGVPALVTINYPATPKFYESGVITDVSEMMAANGFDFDKLIDGVVDQVTVGDAIIGMPWGCTATVYFYNKTILAKHNLDKFPTTWEEFKTWVKDVTEATGVTAVTLPADNGNFFYNMMLNFGGDMQEKDDPTKTALDNENLITRMKELKALVDAGYVEWSDEGADLIATKWLNSDTMVLNTSTEYYYQYLQNMDAVEEGKKFEIGLAWTWKETHDYATVGGNVLCVPDTVSQEEKNAAAVFLNWLNQPENHAKWASYTNNCLIHKESINNQALLQEMYAELPETITAVYPNLEEHYKMKPQTEHYDPVNKEMQEAVLEIFTGEADFDTRWSEAITAIEDILAGN